MRENCLFASLANEKLILTHHVHFQSFLSSPCHSFLCPLLPFMSNVLCPLSHVFVLCLPYYVPCLMSLFLVSRPLSSVSHICSLPTVRCPQPSLFLVFALYPMSHSSAPYFPCPVPCLTWHVPCFPSSFLRPCVPLNPSIQIYSYLNTREFRSQGSS
jgi:hypothetical protein